jgi:hypothetical protein
MLSRSCCLKCWCYSISLSIFSLHFLCSINAGSSLCIPSTYLVA